VVTSLFILYLNIYLGLGNTLGPMIKHLPRTDAARQIWKNLNYSPSVGTGLNKNNR
jgi:hypothetical protein